MPTYGWDASHYDWDRGPVDLAAARADGIEFFTHKASEGTGYTDPQFAYAMARARNAGMPLIGAYCVNRRGDQGPQVDKHIRVLDQCAPFWRTEPFLVQLDCERWSDKDGVYAWEPSLAEIHAWCDIFMSRTGGRLVPIVYAPKWVYGDSGLRGLRYPLWASSYGTNPDVHYRQAYPGDGSSRWTAYSGVTPTILQFGSRTTIGAQGVCDANAFRGTLDQLRALITGDDMGTYPPGWPEPPNVSNEARDYPDVMLADLHAALVGGKTGWGDSAAHWALYQRLDGIQAELDGLSVPAPAPVDPAALRAALMDPEVLAAIAKAVNDDAAGRLRS